MADNVRIRFMVEASEATDYARPFQREHMEREFDPDELIRQRVEASDGGQTVVISPVGTPAFALIRNTSTTAGETVTLAYTNATGAVTVALGIGQVHYTEDITSANITLTSAAATTPLVDVWVGGS